MCQIEVFLLLICDYLVTLSAIQTTNNAFNWHKL